MNWQDVPGWCDFDDIYEDAVKEFPSGAHFVEVGTFFGRSALSMAAKIKESGKQIQFDTIDGTAAHIADMTGVVDEHQEAFVLAVQGDAKGSFKMIKDVKGVTDEMQEAFDKAMKTGTSIKHAFNVFVQSTGLGDHLNAVDAHDLEAVKNYPDASLDFFFLDAEHFYESTKASLLAWLPKMKPGSIFAGHDYTDQFPGVQQAVNEVLAGRDIVVRGSSYWLRI